MLVDTTTQCDISEPGFIDGGAKSSYTVYEEKKEFATPNQLGPAGEFSSKVSIKEKLRNFLTRRPTQESLEKSGILQGNNHLLW